MSLNPFIGTEFETSWQQGFTAGFLAPNEEHNAPLVLTPDQIRAYDEGVLFGINSFREGISLSQVQPSPSNGFAETVAHVGEAVELIGERMHIIHVVKLGKGALATGTAVGAAAFWSFVFLAVLGPNRSVPFFDEAAEQLFVGTISELTETGMISQNLELFMAACDRNDHEVSDLDVMTQQGWWHGGGLFLTFDQARNEALSHEHSENTRVLRFQISNPEIVEMIKAS